MELMERWKRWTGRDEDEDMSAAWALPEGDRPARSDREFSVRATTRLRVMIAQPKRLEDVPAVAEELKSGMTVILNLEGVDRAPMGRILDVLSGVAYALDAAISGSYQTLGDALMEKGVFTGAERSQSWAMVPGARK